MFCLALLCRDGRALDKFKQSEKNVVCIRRERKAEENEILMRIYCLQLDEKATLREAKQTTLNVKEIIVFIRFTPLSLSNISQKTRSSKPNVINPPAIWGRMDNVS